MSLFDSKAVERTLRTADICARASRAEPVAAEAGKDRMVVIGTPGSLASAVARRLAGR